MLRLERTQHLLDPRSANGCASILRLGGIPSIGRNRECRNQLTLRSFFVREGPIE
jgi:hypothetical protein